MRVCVPVLLDDLTCNHSYVTVPVLLVFAYDSVDCCFLTKGGFPLPFCVSHKIRLATGCCMYTDRRDCSVLFVPMGTHLFVSGH